MDHMGLQHQRRRRRRRRRRRNRRRRGREREAKSSNCSKTCYTFPILLINKWTKKQLISEYPATCTDDNMCHVLKNMSFYHLIGPHFLCLLLSPPQGWEQVKHLLSVCVSVSEVKALLHLTVPVKTSQKQKTDEVWVPFLIFIFQYIHTWTKPRNGHRPQEQNQLVAKYSLTIGLWSKSMSLIIWI